MFRVRSPGRLGGKHERYLCAMLTPFLIRFPVFPDFSDSQCTSKTVNSATVVIVINDRANLKGESLQDLELLYLVVRVAEVVVQHPVDDVGDVRLEGVADAREDVVLVDDVEGHAAALQDVQNLKKRGNKIKKTKQKRLNTFTSKPRTSKVSKPSIEKLSQTILLIKPTLT